MSTGFFHFFAFSTARLYLWDAANVVRVGFMAQEVLNDFPQAVKFEADGFFAVDYAQMPEVA